MYLLNTSTLQLEELRHYVPARYPNLDSELEESRHVPPYAILSHVWGEEEVTFRDINEPHAVNLRGYTKIEHCCAQARADGYEYVWVDTCCIDKSSSAELSEAINSMYRWYAEAAVCYAYLEDVSSGEDPACRTSRFRRSKYFERGWTLQEVIAPERVEFFARNWIKIGTKNSLVSVIANITGVDKRILLQKLSLADVSVAKKMSWAAQRRTTRVEDRAYSLMGIFGIHMPLLYGEGENAFIRLQHEIMRTSNDQSIFAWGYYHSSSQGFLFASSPSDFYGSGKVDRILPNDYSDLFASSSSKDTAYKSQFSITNSGIQITLAVEESSSGYRAALSCADNLLVESGFVWIALVLGRDGLYRRTGIGCATKGELLDGYLFKDIIIAHDQRKHQIIRPGPSIPEGPYTFTQVDIESAIRKRFVLCSLPSSLTPLTNEKHSFYWRQALTGDECIMVFQNEVSGEGFVVTIGGWKDSLCVHVAKFHGVEGMDNASSSLSSVDAGYARPQHTLADGSRGCESIPDWAGLPLLSGERVTVTSRSDGTATWSTRVVITVVVDRPQCARVVCPPPKAPVIPGSAGCLEVELPVCASFLPSIPNAQYSGWIHRRG